MRRPIPLIAVFLALALTVAACGGGSGEEETTTSTTLAVATTEATTTTAAATTSSSSTTTTTSTTTSTTTPPGTASPINGMPVEDGGLLERRVIAVKVDNFPKARAQSGLQEADAVIETWVEGVTRFIALFHHSDSEYVGPVRSIRPTDSTILARLGATFVISGGDGGLQGAARERGVSVLHEENYGQPLGYFRMPHRNAPHNLYVSTPDLRATADARGYPDTFGGGLYAIAPWDELPEDEATTITFTWGFGEQVTWVHENGKYRRFAGVNEHNWVDRDGANREQIAVDVLVVLSGTQYDYSKWPATETTGSDILYIFFEGRVLKGTWSRTDNESAFRLYDLRGNAVTVPPGIPWIMIWPRARPLEWD